MSYIDLVTGNRRSTRLQVEPQPPQDQNRTMLNDDNLSETNWETSLPSHQPPPSSIAQSSSRQSTAPIREIITPTPTARQIPPPPAPYYPSVRPSTETSSIEHKIPNAQNPLPAINPFCHSRSICKHSRNSIPDYHIRHCGVP